MRRSFDLKIPDEESRHVIFNGSRSWAATTAAQLPKALPAPVQACIKGPCAGCFLDGAGEGGPRSRGDAGSSKSVSGERVTGSRAEAVRDERVHLQLRVRQEAEAAISASTIAATIAHVMLANGYAQRLQVLRPVR